MAPELTATVPPPPEAKREVALGMTNLGSTCYMNAVLQALAHAPELCMAMDCEPHHLTCPVAKENAEKRRLSPKPSPDGSAEKKPTSGGTRKSRRSGKKSPPASSDGEDGDDLKFCALCEVEQHLARVHEPPASAASISKETDAIAPHAFVHGFINHVAPWFKLGVQEDSHEFLRLLIDAMQKSCSSARNKADQTKENPEIANEESGENSAEEKLKADSEYPFKLFRGTVKSNVTCDSCNASSSKIDPIEDIGLEVTPFSGDSKNTHSTPPPGPPSAALADVSQAFQRFAKAEALDSGYKCDKCGKVGRATKQSRLASVPPILTLHLKRFRYGSGSDKGGSGANGSSQLPRRTGRSELSQLLGSGADFYGGISGSAKIEGHIKFDQIFDIHPYLTPELQEKHKKMICRLFAVVVHAGKNSHSGHYVAYVRNVGKNEWWKMDDARVSRVSAPEVMSAEAYMLFYRVMEHPVAVELRNISKAKEEAAAAAAKAAKEQAACSAVAVEAKAEESTAQDKKVGDRKRMRDPPEFVNSVEWARTKTRFPPSYISLLQRAEEFISENVEFKPEFFSLIKEEASKVGKVGSGPSGVGADDVIGGSEKYSDGLLAFLHTLVSQSMKNCGEASFLLQDSSSSKDAGNIGAVMETAMRGKEKNLVVPVVDADENFL